MQSQTRAHVADDYLRDGVSIYLIDGQFGDRRLGQPVDLVFAPVSDGPTVQEPSIRLPDHIARALLDALAAHYGGTSEAQTLRKDYLAERARVDKLLDHLTVGQPAETVMEVRASDDPQVIARLAETIDRLARSGNLGARG